MAELFSPRSVSSDSTGSANESNLVFTIPPDLSLSDPERSVLAKGLKFVPNSGPIDLFSVKEDTEAFYRRSRLKGLFHNQSSTYNNKDIFEQVNPKSLLGLHLKANFRLLFFFSDNVATILTDSTIRVERDLPTSVQMNFLLSNHCVVGMTL